MAGKRYEVYETADILHQASSLYLAANIPIDYGTGIKYTPVEVHMLKYIIDHPGKNVTQLSRDWDKSKAAISQMLKKMEAKELIWKESAPDSEKKQLYYATEKGIALNKAHIHYDQVVFSNTCAGLKDKFSEDEINLAFQVLEEYIQLRRRKHYRSKEV